MQIFEGKTMGSYWRALVAADISDHQAHTLLAAIEMVLAMINRRMSTYIPDSEIEQFGDYQGSEPFPLSPEMYRVVSKALQICRQTDGIYDITVAPLVNLWGFGPKEIQAYPEEDALAVAKKRVDYRKLTLTDTALVKAEPTLRIDLCSIAKGYGVDKVADLLEALGYHDYLVEIGGETRISGSKNGQNWRIGIERPQSGGGAIEQIIALQNVRLAIATSGNYKNYSARDGAYATHEINPKTGYSQVSKLLSASVLAEDCMSADGYATAMLLLGEEKAPVFAEQHDIPALFIVADEREESQCRVEVSSAFVRLLNMPDAGKPSPKKHEASEERALPAQSI